MKKLFFFLLSVFFISNNSAQQLIMTDPDVISTSTGTINEAMRTAAGIVQGGKDITAAGTLRIPIVFVKFADDNATTTNWPSANVLPSWAANFVNPSIPANNLYQNNNFSKFYDLSSGGNGNGTLGEFQVIGDVYFVSLTQNKSDFSSDGAVSEEVLDILDDPNGSFNVDFSEYDNWEFKVGGVPYTHSNNPDGVLDFMLIYWKDKSISLPSNVGGVAGLGFWDTITKDGIDIISSNGVLGFKAQDYGNEHTIWVSAHEIGHHQFGMTNGNDGSHFNGRADNYGNLQRFGLMTRGDGHQFSAYERYRLGWLDPIVVSSNTNNIVLNETHKSSSNNAILIPVKYNTSGDLEEYFLLENYHSTNAYAEANPFLIQSLLGHTISKGIIAYHVSAENFDWPTLSRVDIESAEGLFAWEVIQGASTPSNRLDDLIAPGIVNLRNGFDERDTITATAGTTTYRDYYALTPETTTNLEEKAKRRYGSDDYLGDQEDLFSIDYNKIFTKWSNPSSIKDDGLDSNVGFEIVSYNSSTHAYTLNVAVNSTGIQEFAPSKPQNLKLSANPGNNRVRLTWDANTEPDISSYEIYRKVNVSGWGYLATTSNNFYVDTQWQYDQGSTFDVKYKIVAKDNTNKASVFSDEVTCHPWPMGKRAAELVSTDIPVAYSLSNFPNPFNPSTKISFSLQQAGHVTLKVYDVLGREVAELVNGVKEKGKHSVMFNANKNASGFYVYTIKVNDFFASKKMLLTK